VCVERERERERERDGGGGIYKKPLKVERFEEWGRKVVNEESKVSKTSSNLILNVRKRRLHKDCDRLVLSVFCRVSVCLTG
jgi:hypothetical protein